MSDSQVPATPTKSKFNFNKTIDKLKAVHKKNPKRAAQFGLGDSLEHVSLLPEDNVVLPDWWRKYFGAIGLPFGKWVQISGRPDAGKTSLSLLAIRCAQEQGYGVIYCETEGKTGAEDMRAAGVDPDGVIAIHTKITEEVFDDVNIAIDAFFNDFPDDKLLVVIDSYGNTTSMRDSGISLTESNAMVGGAAKTNRTGMGSLVAKQQNFPIAGLIVNYSYSNIGSVGETNAGGRALEFYCMLIINASRKKWYERTIGGQKVRAGAEVIWKTTKNHFAKAIRDENGDPIFLPKECNLRISAAGFEDLETKKRNKEDGEDLDNED